MNGNINGILYDSTKVVLNISSLILENKHLNEENARLKKIIRREI